jgi:hypothetical protein
MIMAYNRLILFFVRIWDRLLFPFNPLIIPTSPLRLLIVSAFAQLTLVAHFK